MSIQNNNKTLESFKSEVLIQEQFFAYDTLVKWIHNNSIQNFNFSTKSTKYLFEKVDDGVYIYVYTLSNELTKKLFCSFKNFLPNKKFYSSPENIEFSCSIWAYQ